MKVSPPCAVWIRALGSGLTFMAAGFLHSERGGRLSESEINILKLKEEKHAYRQTLRMQNDS